jgi:hypothetical protein
MDDGARLGKFAVAWVAAAWMAGAAWGAETMTTTHDLLKDPKFKAAYLASLGPKAKESWLARMSNSGLVRTVSVAGEDYQMATPCKPHDCADNNLLLLYSPARGVVYGKLYESGRSTPIGQPSPAMNAELDKFWNKEFRQK